MCHRKVPVWVGKVGGVCWSTKYQSSCGIVACPAYPVLLAIEAIRLSGRRSVVSSIRGYERLNAFAQIVSLIFLVLRRRYGWICLETSILLNFVSNM